MRNRKKDQKAKMLKEQEDTSPWHGYCKKDELIIKSGNVDKRRVRLLYFSLLIFGLVLQPPWIYARLVSALA